MADAKIPDDETILDKVEMTPNGHVRMTIAGTLYRLRRPLFGELKALRVALDEMTGEIAAAAAGARAAGLALREEGEAIPDDTPPAEMEAAAHRLQTTDRAISRTLVETVDALRLGWWRDVFTVLAVGDAPELDDMPAWLTDAKLTQEIVTHWRTVPLARG